MIHRTLYNAPQSTCSQRVRYALNANSLAYEEIKLDLFRGDQVRPEFLKINPNGVVPVLVDGEATITDSSVILEYIDEVYGNLRFSPSAPSERALMRSMIRFIDEIPTPAIRVPSYNLAFLPHFQSMTEAEFQALADSKPLRREFLLKMGRSGFPEQEYEEALGRLVRGVDRLRDWLRDGGGPWAMGRKQTLVDIALMPVLVRMADIGLDALWRGKPEVDAWLDRLRSTAAFGPTYYPGSLLTEQYPHLKDVVAGSNSRPARRRTT